MAKLTVHVSGVNLECVGLPGPIWVSRDPEVSVSVRLPEHRAVEQVGLETMVLVFDVATEAAKVLVGHLIADWILDYRNGRRIESMKISGETVPDEEPETLKTMVRTALDHADDHSRNEENAKRKSSDS